VDFNKPIGGKDGVTFLFGESHPPMRKEGPQKYNISMSREKVDEILDAQAKVPCDCMMLDHRSIKLVLIKTFFQVILASRGDTHKPINPIANEQIRHLQDKAAQHYGLSCDEDVTMDDPSDSADDRQPDWIDEEESEVAAEIEAEIEKEAAADSSCLTRAFELSQHMCISAILDRAHVRNIDEADNMDIVIEYVRQKRRLKEVAGEYCDMSVTDRESIRGLFRAHYHDARQQYVHLKKLIELRAINPDDRAEWALAYHN
jgi:hypothetical protein